MLLYLMHTSVFRYTLKNVLSFKSLKNFAKSKKLLKFDIHNQQIPSLSSTSLLIKPIQSSSLSSLSPSSNIDIITPNKSPKLNFSDLKTDKELSTHEIMYFDILYKKHKTVKSSSSSSVQKYTFKFDIEEILVNKLNTSYHRIVNFLRIRGNKLTEQELLYCIRILSLTNNFQKFMHENEDINDILIERLATIKYTKLNNVMEFLIILSKEEYYKESVWKNLTKFFSIFLYNPNLIYEHNDMLIAIEIVSMDYISKCIDIIKTLNAINKKFFENLEDFELAMEYIRVLQKCNLMKLGFNHEQFANVFLLYYHYVTILQYAEIVNILVRNNITTSFIFAKLIYELPKKLNRIYDGVNEIQKKEEKELEEELIKLEENGSITHDLFSQLCWGISQISIIHDNANVWMHLEDIYLNYLDSWLQTKQSDVFDGISFSRIIHSFNNCNQGSSTFWLYSFDNFTKYATKEYILNMDFGDSMTIFYRRLLAKKFSNDYFLKLVNYEHTFRLNYMPSMQIGNFVKTIYSYIVGLDYYFTLHKNNIQDTLNEYFEPLMKNLSHEINNYLLNHTIELRTMKSQTFFQIFYIIIYGWENKFITILPELKKQILIEFRYKQKKLELLDMIRLICFLTKYNNKLEINTLAILASIKENLTKALPIDLLESIKIMLGLKYDDEYLWNIIELKIIDYLDTFTNADFVSIGILTNFLQKGTSEYWEFYNALLSDRLPYLSEMQVELLKEYLIEQEKTQDILEDFDGTEITEHIKEEINYLPIYEILTLINKEKQANQSILNQYFISSEFDIFNSPIENNQLVQM